MTEAELIEEGFERIDVPIEQSGDEKDYYYYRYELNPHCTLTSNENTEANIKKWIVNCFEIELIIKDIKDLQFLIALFAQSAKIK